METVVGWSSWCKLLHHTHMKFPSKCYSMTLREGDMGGKNLFSSFHDCTTSDPQNSNFSKPSCLPSCSFLLFCFWFFLLTFFFSWFLSTHSTSFHIIINQNWLYKTNTQIASTICVPLISGMTFLAETRATNEKLLLFILQDNCSGCANFLHNTQFSLHMFWECEPHCW